MLVPGDLGFPGLVLVFVCLFLCGPIVSFLIQWKWRIALERKEEIMRLVAMASEEAAKAEFEATGECAGFVGVPRKASHSQCAICYCPTTTRCSRCKVVRYCSGKCQIIHWRKGHKEECHPPSATMWSNGRESNFKQKNLLQEEPQEFHIEDSETDASWCAQPIETYPKKSASYGSSFSSRSFTGKEDDKFDASATTNGPTIGGHVADVPIAGTLNRSKRPLFNSMPPYVVETTNDVYDTYSPPPHCADFSTAVNSTSFSHKLKPNTRSHSVGGFDGGLANSSASSINDPGECTVSDPSMSSSDFRGATVDTIVCGNDVHDNSTEFSEGADDTLPHFPFNCSQRASTSPLQPFNPHIHECDDARRTSLENKMGTNGVGPMDKVLPTESPVKILPVTRSGRSADSQRSESRGRRSFSSIASERHACSNAKRHSVSSLKSLNSSEIASSLSNHSNGLKTSVQKVVQQFRAPKLSKHQCEVAERSNYKMLFPYEIFIKLYNWEKVEFHPCGFTNCGNTCYANAVLQCLAFTQPLTAYLLQGIHSKACSKKEWCFTCEFEWLILKASKGVSPLSPVGIVSRIHSIGPHLSHGKEEDAHEFLRCAIDNMQSVCLKEAGRNALGTLAEDTTLIGLIFGGYLRSKIKCMKCNGKSEQYERMMDLTVEIQGDIVTLEEALGRFTATEILDGENKYQCSRCKSYEKAKKKLTVLEAPNVLTIAFKRFQSGKYGKLNKSIRFPETLNLAPYMSRKVEKSPLYRLYAVVVHLDVMNAAFSGHYVCYVKNIQGNWFKTDDSKVKPVELERVLSKGAYMLLYARCSPQAPDLVRNAMLSNCMKIKRDRSSETTTSNPSTKDATSRARPGFTIMRDDPSTMQRRAEDYPQLRTFDGLSSFESLESLNRRFHQVNRIPRVNSLSDNSSLFSCSDEGSCSTESTRDSISTDDFSDYIFGDSRIGWNSPRRLPDESDPSSSPFLRSSPLAVSHRQTLRSNETRRYPPYIIEQVEESPPILYSDKSNCGRKLRKHTSSISSSNEIDAEKLGRGNHFDMKSGISMRSTWERTTAQTFY